MGSNFTQTGGAGGTGIQSVPEAPPDVWIYRLIVIVLGLIALLTALGSIWLASDADPNTNVPPEVIALAAAAVGAMAGLLAPTPVSK